jgi:hypothetical protein
MQYNVICGGRIPAPNNDLRGLVKVNTDIYQALNTARPHHTATLDMDATLLSIIGVCESHVSLRDG